MQPTLVRIGSDVDNGQYMTIRVQGTTEDKTLIVRSGGMTLWDNLSMQEEWHILKN